ncbi:MAG: ATP-binding cassette domain-containing protein [Paramuribaculum sp.]|nr:ATP-binding cassette domain-containing protein [Paramuribaculum sp.]
MEKIELCGLIPEVFAREQSGNMRDSGIWLSEEAVGFRRGCRLLIESASGKGKSSLVSFIYGRRTDYRGLIAFDGADIRLIDSARWTEIRRKALAWLPQEMMLFPELTARENVEIKRSLTGWRSGRWVEEAFEQLGIADRIDSPVGRMSVGQQQRVAIIRALAQPADFILLDEPVSHLDPQSNLAAASFIEEEASSTGAGIITTSVGNPLALNYTSTTHL